MKKLVIILFSFLAFNKISGQDYKALLSKFYINYPQEKIYAHLDKDNYVAGENIWFKIYILSNGTPSFQSSDCFIELVRDDGTVIDKKTLPVFWGTSYGNIELSTSLPKGNYFIRCYTALMLNFNNAPLFKRVFYIYNASDSSAKNVVRKDIYSIQFLPEGGNMINDVNNTIAFKAIDQYGYPANVSGEVRDDRDSIICTLKTIHDGMGKFVLKPKPNKIYHALVKFPGDEIRNIVLPQGTSNTMTLRIEGMGDDKNIFILRSRIKKKDTTHVILVAQQNGKVVLNRHLYLTQEESFYRINTRDLPSGIMQVTLFDNNNNPLAERLIFISNNSSINCHLNTDSINLNKKGKNAFKFFVTDSLDGSYSISVTDAERSVPSSDKKTLPSEFLLCSDIKGYIHNSSYYFINNSDSIRQALDLVLLTSGWRRFKWNEILNNNLPVIKYNEKSYISIKGQVINKTDKKPVKNGTLNLIYKYKDLPNDFFQVIVDSLGFFELDSMVFYEKADFYFTYTDKKGRIKDVKVILKNPYRGYSSIPDSEALPSILNNFSEKDILKFIKNQEAYTSSTDSFFHKKIINLKEIKIKGKRKKSELQLIDDRYTNNLFAGPAERTLDLITNPKVAGMLRVTDLIKNNFPELLVVTAHDKNSFDLNGSTDRIFKDRGPTSIYKPNDPGVTRLEVTVYIDEQERNLEVLRDYKSSDIALIKYYSSFAMAPNNGPAIVLYTKKGSDIGQPANVVTNKFTYPGYSYTKEFYSPDYSDKNLLKSPFDNRVTVYWNANLFITKKTQSNKIIFYNSDVCKRMHVVIEGFNSEGRLCHIEKDID